MINNQFSSETHKLDAPHLSQPDAEALAARTLPNSVSGYYIKKPKEPNSITQKIKELFCCCCTKTQDEETLSIGSLGVDYRPQSLETQESIQTQISPLTKERFEVKNS
ncbi:hypothetical protein D5018_18305 [Parashewanella curva]|uniref:Uncharacterized protein n=1 Tax=Parashewanella curva TaxID=2338552 RepID=A0A3L8PS57_9GAMM|nr:hypothetical protein [Parashewanella curva]RLV58257.1 hypothetical protein D5018_18305 [Parashewanella curva]